MAPAARRGGWISAERRRRRMAAGDEKLDASNIVPRLWVGGQPPFDRDLPAFDVLVLCAAELQPERPAFSGLVIRCPIPDDRLTTAEASRALATAKMVSDSLLAGHRVLVTCAAGINRSVLVASLALNRITRMGADDLVRVMRTRRHPTALYNRHFQELLRTFTTRRR
jgi:protein-tyrosine phosphatase